MTYKGHVENGVIVLDEPTALREGDQVQVNSVERDEIVSEHGCVPLATRLASVIGKARDLPKDWAENRDQYLRDAK